MKRARFVEHVGWTGAGISFALSAAGTFAPLAAGARARGASFVQISDSHIGFHQPANEDVAATLQRAVDRINALPQQPDFVMHTGDVTHLAKPEQFDTAHAVLKTLKAPLFVIPGEHDVIGSPQNYTAAFGRADAPDGWFAWDGGGVHFVALVNVFGFEKMGILGTEQLTWLAKDLATQKSDTPIVVFGHVPLYAVYEPWGWTTEDGAKALTLLRRFSAVTVLNGHIHQILSHTEGNMRFYTANATAYPQPAPGTADRPGPLTVPPDHLLGVLGYRTVRVERAAADVDDRNLT